MKRNNPFLFLCLVGFMTGAICMQVSIAFSQSRYYKGHLEPEDANSVAAVRQAGLHSDQSQALQIVKSLQAPVHIAYLYTSIHALAQMGSETSLPEINRHIWSGDPKEDQEPDVSNFASVAKARLLAESKTRTETDVSALASAKTHIFLTALGLSPSDLNSDLASYNAPQSSSDVNGKDVYVSSSDAPRVHPVGVYATREIADMIYHGRYQDYATLPEVQTTNFAQDYPSALKVRLAQVPQSSRITTIIQELSHKTMLSFNDYYEIQLAVNEGTSASDAAANELKKMDKNREQYSQVNHHSGFTAMFQIIWGVGDKKQAPLLAYFKNDNDRFVVHYATIMYNDVLQGVKRESEPAY